MALTNKNRDIPWVEPSLKGYEGIVWKEVESSNIKAVAYDEAKKTLLVAFRKNLVYSYTPINKSLFMGLLKAPSKGTYFTNQIRNLPGIKVFDFRKGGHF